MLYATVRQRKIHVKKPETVIRNGINVDWLILDMDDEWKEMDSIVAVFTNGSVSLEMLHTFGEPLLVPWECLKETGLLSVSCTGYVADEQIMTTKLPDSFWNVVQNGPITGGTPMEPTATLYEQILAAAGSANSAADRANQVSDQLLQDKENGVFNGEDGTGLQVRGLYATLGALQKAHPSGSVGEAYAVGTETKNVVYIWDADALAWVSIGEIQGPAGRGIAEIYIKTDGSWVITYTDGTEEILVPASDSDGPNTPSQGNVSSITQAEATVDNNTGTPEVDVSLSDNGAGKTIAFAFRNLKGGKGDKGDPGAGVQSMTYNSSTNQWTVLLTDGNSLTVDGPSIPDVSGYMPKSGGTFTGSVKAAAASTTAYYIRNIKFSTSEETPTTEGDICFKLA